MTPLSSLRLVPALALIAACGSPKPRPQVANRPPPSPPLVVAVDPKLVDLTGEATTTLVAASTISEIGVRFRIEAKSLPAANRPPLDLGLVLDTSGSMEGAAIDELRSSARRLVDKMRDGDRLSVIAFHSRAEVLVAGTTLGTESRKRVTAAIDGITARGTTDLASGLAAGLQQVAAGQVPGAIKRIVLLSDGVPNASGQLANVIASVRQYRFPITTLGLGVDYDTTLMTQLSRDTGGSFHYIEEPDQVAAVFDDELTRMTTVVGSNLVLTLEAGPGVTFQAMPGLVLGGDGKAYATLGDLPAGEVRDLMIPIKVSARGDRATAELIDASLAFDDTVGHSGRLQRSAFVGVKASADVAEVRRAVKIDLEVARIRTAAAGAILEAITLARQGQIAPAQQRIAAAITAVRAASTRLKDPELAKMIDELTGVSKQLAQLVVQQQIVVTSVNDKAPSIDAGASIQSVPAVAPPMIESSLRRAQERAQTTVSGQRQRRR